MQRGGRRRIVRSLPLMVCLFLLSCVHFGERRMVLTDLLPLESEIPGWELLDRQVAFSRDRSTDPASPFVRNGIDVYACANYRSFSEEKIRVKIEIMQFGSVLDAFGLFSVERSDASRPSPRGNDAFTTEAGLFAWNGDFYCRLNAENRENCHGRELAALYEVLAGKIGAVRSPDRLPAHAFLFADANDTGTLVYYKNGHPLLPGSTSVFVRNGNNPLFYRKESFAYDARRGYNRLLVQGKEFTLSETAGLPYAFRPVPGGLLFISCRNQYIFGTLRADTIDDGIQILERMRVEIAALR